MTGSVVIKDTLSDITEDFDLLPGGEQVDGAHPIPPARSFETPPRSHLQQQQQDDDDDDPPPQPTFLSPFSSKTCQRHGDNDAADNFQLSLYATRPVSIVIYVNNPPSNQNQKRRLPCVFPPLLALEGRLSQNDDNDNDDDDDDDDDTKEEDTGQQQHNKQQHDKRQQQPPSPTTAALTATTHTRDLVILNPTAFGTTLPNHVHLDILNSITRFAAQAQQQQQQTQQQQQQHDDHDHHHISSEDWIRLYRFHQVWWPRGRTDGLDRVATALAHDATAPASIAQRVVLGKTTTAEGSTSSLLWGTVVHATVAQAFARSSSQQQQDDREGILETYGLLGWILHRLGQRLTSTSSQPRQQLTLSALHVVPHHVNANGRDVLQDLLQTRSSSTTQQPSLRHHGGSTVVSGLTQVPVDAHQHVKAVGHLMRRAWMAAAKKTRGGGRQQPSQRGHVVVTIRLYCNAQQVSDENAHCVPSITLVDLAPMATSSSSTSSATGATGTLSPRRNAAVRQTLSVLGGVLRGQLLKAAGNPVAIPYRESVLTQVLHGVMERPDSRTLLLTGISALKDDYDVSMADLRYCSRILERPGEAPKSPFDSLSKAATSPTSQMSHSTTASAAERRQRGRQSIMMEQFDPKYHSDLLRNVTADPRQRFSRAGLQPARQRVALATSQEEEVEAYIPPDYMDIDPGAVLLRPVYDTDRKQRERTSHGDVSSPNLNTTLTLDSMERGDMDEDDEEEPDFLQPSPLATFTGSNEFASVGSYQNNNRRMDEETDEMPPENDVEPDSQQQDTETRGRGESSLNADMDELSLELRRAEGTDRADTPSGSAMDNLSYELFHNNNEALKKQERQPEDQPSSLEALDESPIKEMQAPPDSEQSSHEAKMQPVDLTSLPPERNNYPRPRGASEHSHDSAPPAVPPQRFPMEYFPHQPSAGAHTQRAAQQYFRRTVPPRLPAPPSHDDLPGSSSMGSNRPNSEHVDLTLYRVTPRGATGLPSDIVVNHADRQTDENDQDDDVRRAEGASGGDAAAWHNNKDQEGPAEAPRYFSHLVELQSVDSSKYSLQHSLNGGVSVPTSAARSFDNFLGTETQVDTARRSHLEPPSQRSSLDPPSQHHHRQTPPAQEQEDVPAQQMQEEDELSDLESQRDQHSQNEDQDHSSPQHDVHEPTLGSYHQEQTSAPNYGGQVLDDDRREHISMPPYDHARAQQTFLNQNNRAESPDFFPSDGSETQAEIGQIDSLLNEIREKTKSRSQSISKDLTLIEQNQRSVVRRLVAERDTARRDLDNRTEEQLRETTRREQDLRELRRSLESVHAERKELEQIAEEAVTGREGLERRALELERALKRKEEESVSRNEYLLLKDECDDVKRILEERSDALSKLKREMSEQTTSVSNLEVKLRDMEQEKLDLQSRLQNEKAVVGKMDERNGKIQSELDSLRSDMIMRENERKLLESEMDSTKRSLQLSLEQKDKFAKSLSDQLEQLQIDLHESQTNLWAKEESIGRLQKEKSTNSQKIENLLQRIKELEEEVQYLKTSKNEIEKELGDRLRDTKELSEALRQVSQERDEAENKLEEAERLRKQAQAKTKRVEEETTKFRNEASRRIESFLKKHKENEEVIKDQESDMRALGDEKEELRMELEALRKENQRVRASGEELKTKLEEVTRSRTSLTEHEQSQLKQLRESKNDLQSKIESLNQQLVQREEQFRLQTEAERKERLRSEAERDASRQAQLDNAEKLRIEAEQNAVRQMEEELEKFKAESEEKTRNQVEEAREQATEEAERKAKLQLEEELARIRREAESNAQRQIENERGWLRRDAENNIQRQVDKEREKIRLEAERNAQERVETEREKVRLESESDLRRQLREEREKMRQESEVSLRAQVETERERVRREFEDYSKQTMAAERQKLRLEAEQAVEDRLNEERERLRLEAQEDMHRRAEEERDRIRAEADREAKQQMETEFERLRSESELDAQRQLDDMRRRFQMEAEEAAKTQLDDQLEEVRREAQEDLRRQLDTERENLRVQAERNMQRQAEIQRDELRTEAQRDMRRQMEDERERLRIQSEESARREADKRIERVRAEAERDAQRQLDAERNRIRIEAEDAVRRETEEERERLRIEAERYARRLAEEERERARVEFGRRTRRQAEEDQDSMLRLEEDRERQRMETDREARRLVKEERERRRAESERDARIRAEEERANRQWAESERAARADVGRRLRLDSEPTDRSRSRRLSNDDRLDYRADSDYDTPRDRLGAAGGARERAIYGQDDYRRLEEVTVALAQALHSQSRTGEDDIAQLLRQFHAAEDAITAHNRYFRTRIEGLRHTTSKR